MLVCGGTASARLPQTLWRPCEIGSSRLAQKLSSVSKIGVADGCWRDVGVEAREDAVVDQRTDAGQTGGLGDPSLLGECPVRGPSILQQGTYEHPIDR